MRTKLVGEWTQPNQKQASRLASHHIPETRRGFVERTTRQRLRVFCGECKKLRSITECTRISAEKENSSTYDVTLECGHLRSVTLAVEFTPSQKEKRGWTQETETEIPEIEPVDPEILEIRADLESEQLL